MQCGKRFCESFVVSGQTTESRRPCEAALDDPTSRQQHEAAFCFGMFDDFQLDAMFGSGLCSRCVGVSLIDIGQFDMLAGDLLHGLGQHADLRAILRLISRRYVQRQQMPKRVNGGMNLRSLAPLGTVVTAACA